jgi:hypothetical protein
MGDFGESGVLIVIWRLLLTIDKLFQLLEDATVKHVFAARILGEVNKIIDDFKSSPADF